MTGNAQLLNQDALACVEQGLGRSSAQGQMNASLLKFHLFPQTSLREKGLNQGQRAEAACPIQSSMPFQDTAVPSSFFLAGLAGSWVRSHLVYDLFQLKISSRLEEGETSRFGRVPQRRRPPRNETRRLLSPFILSSVRKNSVKARKYSKMTSWLQAGKGSWRRKPQWPPWRLSRRKK